jgi:aconitate hydratase
MLSQCGALSKLIAAGARILECACGPCIGMGQSPNSAGISLRTFNRNFEGRSGTADAGVFLVSPETAAAAALTGVLKNPMELDTDLTKIKMPETFVVNDNMIDPPAPESEAAGVEILRGPNIKPFPKTEPLADSISAKAILKVGDNITTDHIMPAGAKILPLRSNIPMISNYCFTRCDEDFPENCRKEGQGIIIGGENYGQGSSREHAALAPLHLGIKAVITKSFARIHVANLVNAGIVPLTFDNAEDYDTIDRFDELELPNIRSQIKEGKKVILINKTKNLEYTLTAAASERSAEILLSGGLLRYTKENS